MTAAALARGTVGVFQLVSAYVSLMKPRIIVLLLITTVPAMVLAAGGWPNAELVAVTLLAGTLSSGGANAINCYIDRDIDGAMVRTCHRPIPSGLVSPGSALLFGVALGGAAFLLFWFFATPQAAFLSTFALLFYVFVYTKWLKRSSSQNIVIGGAAGAFPPVVGWAAVTGTVPPAAWILFAIIFFWTPPHFWALALNLRRDYAAVNVPMLPVARGVEETRREILLYSVILVGVSLLLVPAAQLGWVYLTPALLLDGLFIAHTLRLWSGEVERAAWALFKYSLLYLSALFMFMALDTTLPR